MFGTSTTVSLKALGLLVPRACSKCSLVTYILSKTSASMVSSSKSMRSIFSLMHCSAASVQSAARSLPTKPCVFLLTFSRSTSSPSFMFLVWILMISSLPTSSGTPMSISLSNLPNLLNAGSMEFGLLVAPMTMMWLLFFMPSIKVRSWDTILLSTSPWVFSLFGAIESISSMKMIEGEFFSASSKAFLKLDSDSPASLDMISGPLMRKKKAPVSFATALAIKVLPLPGGP
mmetsp:Transcript_3097/g.8451  ORF Transcript_3097/g.8451 Transcript_3097/m.8451 type:complete len:231 (-) Transcript_3097:802-1494(-)